MQKNDNPPAGHMARVGRVVSCMHGCLLCDYLEHFVCSFGRAAHMCGRLLVCAHAYCGALMCAGRVVQSHSHVFLFVCKESSSSSLSLVHDDLLQPFNALSFVTAIWRSWMSNRELLLDPLQTNSKSSLKRMIIYPTNMLYQDA